MTDYKNLNGDSGIIAYEIFDTYIRIQFEDEEVYVYSYDKPGEDEVEHMKKLAEEGKGLNTYINQKIRKKFDYKE